MGTACSKAKELAQLVTDSRTFMSQIAKAKTAKLSEFAAERRAAAIELKVHAPCEPDLVRTLIDYFPPSSRDLQMQVTNDNIAWARQEKRVFLRQSLEIKLVGL